MTIECSRCGGNHMRSECPDVAAVKTLAMCNGEGIKRMTPQGSPFHWRDGWMFCRGEAGAVHVYNSNRQDIDLRIPFAEWQSILRHLNGNLP